ncbi:MAG: AhpC/TSA family protein [Actinomycetota bacterium]
MGERLTDLGDDTAVVLVTFTSDDHLSAYQARHELPFPVLIDRDRVTYGAYGLGRGSVHHIWGLRSAQRYIEIVRANGLSGLRRPTEDTLQLGGDFVIDAAGRLAWGFWGTGPADRPSVDQLVDALDRARVDE